MLLGLLKLINPEWPWYLPLPLAPTPPKGKWQFKSWTTASLTTKLPDVVLFLTNLICLSLSVKRYTTKGFGLLCI